MGFGELAAGHRQRQLDVVWRVGRHEVDRGLGEGRQDVERVTDPHLDAGRFEGPGRARIGRPEIRDGRTVPVALGGKPGDDLLVHGHPARVELDAESAPRSARDRGADQRAADAGERVEHQLIGLAEELDQAGHEPRWLVGTVDLARHVPELRRIGRRQDRLREVEPLLAGQFVEGVVRVGGSAAVSHDAQRSRSWRRVDFDSRDAVGQRGSVVPARHRA